MSKELVSKPRSCSLTWRMIRRKNPRWERRLPRRRWEG